MLARVRSVFHFKLSACSLVAICQRTEANLVPARFGGGATTPKVVRLDSDSIMHFSQPRLMGSTQFVM